MDGVRNAVVRNRVLVFVVVGLLLLAAVLGGLYIAKKRSDDMIAKVGTVSKEPDTESLNTEEQTALDAEAEQKAAEQAKKSEADKQAQDSNKPEPKPSAPAQPAEPQPAAGDGGIVATGPSGGGGGPAAIASTGVSSSTLFAAVFVAATGYVFYEYRRSSRKLRHAALQIFDQTD